MSSVPLTSPPGQPQFKAAPTAQVTGTTASVPNNEATTKGVNPPRVNQARKEASPTDPTSLLNTLVLIERVLTLERTTIFEARPELIVIEEILPPLTSSNAVDVELYAILAIIVKDFVNTWYSKITNDRDFVEEIVQIVAHCSRALEQRLRHIDIAALLLDEIPLLVTEHIKAYRTARLQTINSPYGLSIHHIYHELSPHPALTLLPAEHDSAIVQQQAQDEREYRQLLIQGSLAILLPNEELENGPLRVLVGDIIADLIVGRALARKLCEGWFLHDTIFKVTSIVSDKLQPKTDGSEIRDDAKNRLEEIGLLSSDSNSQHSHSSAHHQSALIKLFWRTMQYGYLMYLFVRYVIKDLQHVRRKPKRQHHIRDNITPLPDLSEKAYMQMLNVADLPPRPVLAFDIFSMISTLLRVVDRMPWVAGMFDFWRHTLLVGTGRLGALDSIIDRFLYHTIETHMVPPSLLPTVLRNLRTALFPNNSMGPPAPPPPSDEETRAIKHKAAKSIHALIPAFVTRTFYGSVDQEPTVSEIEEDILDPFDDAYLNKHLVYGLLELVLVRLIPELGEQTISDLLAGRGVEIDEPASSTEEADKQAIVVSSSEKEQ